MALGLNKTQRKRGISLLIIDRVSLAGWLAGWRAELLYFCLQSLTTSNLYSYVITFTLHMNKTTPYVRRTYAATMLDTCTGVGRFRTAMII
jgi:hypothetical protein